MYLIRTTSLSTLTACLLTDIFRQFIFSVIISVFGLLSTTFVGVLHSHERTLYLLFFLPFPAFSGFNQAFHIIPFFLLS